MPRPRKNYDRVIGVYGKRVVRFVNGERCADIFGSEEEAQTKAEEFAQLYARKAITIEEAMSEWIDSHTLVEVSRIAHKHWLLQFFGDLSVPLESITKAKCEANYASCIKRYAVATHHRSLWGAKDFLQWCVKKGYIKQNHAAHIEAFDTPKRGKDQLTLDEAKKVVAVCFAELENPQAKRREEALALLSCLYLGTRKSEVVLRLVRDLDANGTVLRIPYGKSKNAVRRLVLPQELRPYWQERAKGKLPLAPLFDITLHDVYYWVGQFCKRAGVPEVCPHSLRGLHATLAVQNGVQIEAVARSLGHGVQMAKQHYVQPGTIEQAQVDLVTSLIREEP